MSLDGDSWSGTNTQIAGTRSRQIRWSVSLESGQADTAQWSAGCKYCVLQRSHITPAAKQFSILGVTILNIEIRDLGESNLTFSWDYKAIQLLNSLNENWKWMSLLTLFMEICPELTRVWRSPGQVQDTWHVQIQLSWRDNSLYKYWDHILPEVDKGGQVLFCHIQIHDHNLCERVEGNSIRADSIYQTLKASFVTFKTSNLVRLQCSSFDKRMGHE